MKVIINFFKNLFSKTDKNQENYDIDSKINMNLWDPPKNVEIYQEIRDEHQKSEGEKPKKRKPAKPKSKKVEELKEAPAKKTRKKKSE
jgi:hypothetical protein